MNTNITSKIPRDPIQAALIDVGNYHDQEEWFRLLQDDGIGFTKIDTYHWGQKPNKRKSRHITFQGMHYKQLFTLAQNIYSLYNSEKESYFGNILKNKSDAIHKIGMYIANNRYSAAKGDIHSIGQGFDYKQFTSNEEYKDRKAFYFVEQELVLKHFLELWSSSSLKEQLKTTPSDRLRAIGLLFQEDLRKYIPYILSATDRQKRLTRDEWSRKRNTCYHLLTERFIDPEYVVAFPPKWFLEQTKQKINTKFDSAPGKTWDDFNSLFDPNDPARIALPRTESFLKHIVCTTLSTYNTVMIDYTKNTGGGDGEDAAITIWQEREDADILNYHWKLKNNVYLTVVHMYNKMYDFPLVVVKDSVPAEIQIDDSRTEMVSPMSDRGAKRKQDLDYVKLFEETRASNKKIMAMCQEVVAQLQKDNAPPKKSVFELIQNISQSHDFTKKFEIDISNLKEKKKSLQAQMISNPETFSENEINEVDKDIEYKQTVLKTLKVGLLKQNEELKKFMNTDGEI